MHELVLGTPPNRDELGDVGYSTAGHSDALPVAHGPLIGSSFPLASTLLWRCIDCGLVLSGYLLVERRAKLINGLAGDSRS